MTTHPPDADPLPAGAIDDLHEALAGHHVVEPIEPIAEDGVAAVEPPLAAATPAPASLGLYGDRTCLLLGPAGVGKTAVLAALMVAGHRGDDAHPGLSVLRDGAPDVASALPEEAVAWIGYGRALVPTASPHAHPLELSDADGGRLAVCALSCVDTPGPRFFADFDGDVACAPTLPLHDRRDLTQADALVFVVDPTRRTLATLHARLPGLLDRIADVHAGELLDRRGLGGLLDRVRRRARRAPRRIRINAARMLVLINRIDLLVDDAARALQRSGVALTAERLARSLDPVAVAIDLVGRSTLQRLLGAIGADAQLAVGLCSATGFDPTTGAALLTTHADRGPDERLGAWHPFGIADAFRFVAWGRCGGAVEAVTADTLGREETLRVATHAFEEAP